MDTCIIVSTRSNKKWISGKRQISVSRNLKKIVNLLFYEHTLGYTAGVGAPNKYLFSCDRN